VKRRSFITLSGGTPAAGSLAAGAPQPVIGFLHSELSIKTTASGQSQPIASD